MLQNDIFYWGTIRKYIGSFGALFNNLHFTRTAPNSTTKTIMVPITYGPKEKWVYRTKQDPMPGVDDQIEMLLPRMSFELLGYQYDNARKLQSTGRSVKALMSGNTTLKTQFNPVPYNFTFNLNIETKTNTDLLMIVEQILPFFTPDYAMIVNDMPPMGITKAIPVVLNSVQPDDTWTGSFEDRRTILTVMTFTLKGYLYPPTSLTKVNLSAQINFEIDGALANAPVAIPSITTGPSPDGATAETIVDGTVTQVPSNVIVLATPMSATLSSTQHTVFTISVLNSDNQSFTVTGVPSIDTVSITGNNVTYTAGTRSASTTAIVTFTSVANPLSSVSVVLTLNP